MRTSLSILSVLLLFSAQHAHSSVAISKLTLDPEAKTDQPGFAVLEEDGSVLRLEMRLPSLDQRDIVVDSEVYHALTIPGGDIRGEVGQAGLPVITRLVAVPDDAAGTGMKQNKGLFKPVP